MKWISVKDRLPTKKEFQKNNGWFIVWLGDCPRSYIERYDKYDKSLGNRYKHGWKADIVGHYITHWMPLPPFPKE